MPKHGDPMDDPCPYLRLYLGGTRLEARPTPFMKFSNHCPEGLEWPEDIPRPASKPDGSGARNETGEAA